MRATRGRGSIAEHHQGETAAHDAELRREGERIAQLVEELATIGGSPVRQRAEELVGRLLHLYGAGLSALIQILRDAGVDDAADARLVSDPLISSLLLLHGLHPDQSVAAALDPDVPPVAVSARGRPPDLVQIDRRRVEPPTE